MKTNPHLRYWLFQIPGMTIVILVVASLYFPGWINGATAGVILTIWLGKDLLLYPFLYRSYASGDVFHGKRKLPGRSGEVVQPLDPLGTIRVSGELWRARTHQGVAVERGVAVTVKSVDGMVLVVDPVPESSGDGEEGRDGNG